MVKLSRESDSGPLSTLEVSSLPTPLLSFPASPLPATTSRQTPEALGKGLRSNFKTLCMHLPTPGPLSSIPGSQFPRMLTAHTGQCLYYQIVTRAPNTLIRLELCSIIRPAQLWRKHSDLVIADLVRKALEGHKAVTLSMHPLLAPLAARSQLLMQTVPQEPHCTHWPAASFVPGTMDSAWSLSAWGLGLRFFITA